MEDKILNLEQAATFLNISVKTLIKLLKDEHIPARKLGREWRFSRDMLIKWLAEGDSNDYSSQSEIYLCKVYKEETLDAILLKIENCLKDLRLNNNVSKLIDGAPRVSIPEGTELSVIYKQRGDAEKLEFKISWLKGDIKE